MTIVNERPAVIVCFQTILTGQNRKVAFHHVILNASALASLQGKAESHFARFEASAYLNERKTVLFGDGSYGVANFLLKGFRRASVKKFYLCIRHFLPLRISTGPS